MNKNTRKINGFTLIELLMVVAIIGILAGILIPAVGAVRTQANIAASKAQLSQYVSAIQMFKGEYGFYPFVTGQSDLEVSLASESGTFIKTLSGRDSSGTSVSEGGNRRRIGFHGFAESEFFFQDDDTPANDQLADRFNNVNIYIVIDGDGDGFVTPSGSATQVRAPVTAYVVGDSALNVPGYNLWD